MPEASWGGDAVWDFANEWTSGTQIDLNAAATPQNLGAAVAGSKRIVTKLLVRHAGTNNTVVSLVVAGVTRESFDIPAQTTRLIPFEVVFVTGEQPQVQTSNVVGGDTFVSASGVEA
jgi:hypothetical protein